MSRGGRCYDCNYVDDRLYSAMRDFPGLIAVAAGNRSLEWTGGYFVTPAGYGTDNPGVWTGLPNVISV